MEGWEEGVFVPSREVGDSRSRPCRQSTEGVCTVISTSPAATRGGLSNVAV